MSKNTACLSNEGAFTSFAFGDWHIRFRTSEKLLNYVEVKEWDKGYIVVTANYEGQGEVEEYIDLQPILENLLIDAESFLKPIETIEIQTPEEWRKNRLSAAH